MGVGMWVCGFEYECVPSIIPSIPLLSFLHSMSYHFRVGHSGENPVSRLVLAQERDKKKDFPVVTSELALSCPGGTIDLTTYPHPVIHCTTPNIISSPPNALVALSYYVMYILQFFDGTAFVNC